MSRITQIREGLRNMAAKHGPLQTLLAEVVSVDEAAMTCVIREDGVDVYDVRLRPVLNGKESLTIFPKVGGYVLASRIEDDEEWMVIAVDEMAKFRIVAGDTIYESDGSRFLIGNAQTSVKDILNDLVDETVKIYAPKNVAAFAAIKIKITQLFQ